MTRIAGLRAGVALDLAPHPAVLATSLEDGRVEGWAIPARCLRGPACGAGAPGPPMERQPTSHAAGLERGKRDRLRKDGAGAPGRRAVADPVPPPRNPGNGAHPAGTSPPTVPCGPRKGTGLRPTPKRPKATPMQGPPQANWSGDAMPLWQPWKVAGPFIASGAHQRCAFAQRSFNS